MMTAPSPQFLTCFPLGDSGSGPLHGQVRQLLRAAIEEHFEDGQSFWTERLLIEQLGVARGTLRQALDELTREGVLVREAKRGSFVCKSVATCVGVIFEDANSDFVSEMIQKLALQCGERDLSLNLYPLIGRVQVDELVEKVRHPPVQERILLLIGDEEQRRRLHLLLSTRGYQVVSLDESESESGISCVATDSQHAVRLAIDHLTSLGHERITFLVNEPRERLSVASKVKECHRLFIQRGLSEGRVVECQTHTEESSFDNAYEMMPSLWQGAARPTAIFTASDPGAWAALRWFAEHGVKVPGEVSVLGYEGVKPDAFTYPPLSTVAHPLDELARRALDELWTLSCSQVRVEPQLIVRQSTGKSPI